MLKGVGFENFSSLIISHQFSSFSSSALISLTPGSATFPAKMSFDPTPVIALTGIQVLNVGEELKRQILPLKTGQSVYDVCSLKESRWYEVKISYPSSVPASFSLQMKSNAIYLGLNKNRRLLDTEKLTFKTDHNNLNSGNSHMYLLVTVEPVGAVAKLGVQEGGLNMYKQYSKKLLIFRNWPKKKLMANARQWKELVFPRLKMKENKTEIAIEVTNYNFPEVPGIANCIYYQDTIEKCPRSIEHVCVDAYLTWVQFRNGNIHAITTCIRSYPNVTQLQKIGELELIFLSRTKSISRCKLRGNIVEGHFVTLQIVNKCPFPIWPATAPNAGHPVIASGGFFLPSGQAKVIQAPATWSGRLWARTDCNFRSNFNCACKTGDCQGLLSCNGAIGLPPATLVEVSLQEGKPSFYDISIVDGYNLPISVSTKPFDSKCLIKGCIKDINALCPQELQLLDEDDNAVIACKSACLAFNLDVFCCRNEYGKPESCRPSLYSDMFKDACPSYVSYAYDSPPPLVSCSCKDFVVTFCPSSKWGSDLSM
ncbi:uncharacterized protein LOC109835449 [Asparagus officinalis]|uniref:uncharacterized protein LOC109835449 n=1 Tax=Asparagus officinalis TaxID=4686 RepID=UPI00098E63EA|nr:uncharacterized protein LOC109835449 [Asparagus officinalis]